jgi:hypothetical protein
MFPPFVCTQKDDEFAPEDGGDEREVCAALLAIKITAIPSATHSFVDASHL